MGFGATKDLHPTPAGCDTVVDMPTTPDLAELGLRLAAARDALLERRVAVEAGHPWPLGERFGTEPEASWGPAETLAHVAEMLPFWLGEVERILDGAAAGEPVPFGRVADDPLRLGVIERDRSLPPRELFGRVETGASRVLSRLAELDEAEGGRRGLHPRLGEMTVAEILERFVVDHADEHVRQLDAALGARQP